MGGLPVKVNNSASRARLEVGVDQKNVKDSTFPGSKMFLTDIVLKSRVADPFLYLKFNWQSNPIGKKN